MNWDKVRDQFPITKNYIFFDLANKCALPVFSCDVIKDYINKQQDTSGNKNEWFATIADARKNFAAFINADPTEIAFTKNTSEGLNIAANGIPFKAGENVILNEFEHPNNIYCWKNLTHKGVETKWVSTVNGETTLEHLKATIDSSTRAVAIALVTYAPGIRNDIKAIVEYCRPRGIYTIVDAVQAVGTLQVDVKDLGCDMLSTSGHKAMFVPHGVGVFYCRKEIIKDIFPTYLARSGMSQSTAIENDTVSYDAEMSQDAIRYEIGNYNYLGLTVFNESVKYLTAIGMDKIEKRMLDLNQYLVEKLVTLGVEVNSPLTGPQRSAIVCFKMPNAKQIYEKLLTDKVITTYRRGFIRVSLGIYNNEEDIDRFIEILTSYLE